MNSGAITPRRPSWGSLVPAVLGMTWARSFPAWAIAGGQVHDGILEGRGAARPYT